MIKVEVSVSCTNCGVCLEELPDLRFGDLSEAQQAIKNEDWWSSDDSLNLVLCPVCIDVVYNALMEFLRNKKGKHAK
jgi:hypothetical protein